MLVEHGNKKVFGTGGDVCLLPIVLYGEIVRALAQLSNQLLLKHYNTYKKQPVRFIRTGCFHQEKYTQGPQIDYEYCFSGILLA